MLKILKSFWYNINIEFSEKNNVLFNGLNGLKLTRVRAYQREINNFDIALYRQDGTTLKMIFFNAQNGLEDI